MVIFSGKDLGRRERNGRISGHHDACVTSILCLQYDGRFVMLTNSTDHIDMDVFRPHGEWDVDRTQSLDLAPPAAVGSNQLPWTDPVPRPRTSSLGIASAPSASYQLPRPRTRYLGLKPGTSARNTVPRPHTSNPRPWTMSLGLAQQYDSDPGIVTSASLDTQR